MASGVRSPLVSQDKIALVDKAFGEGAAVARHVDNLLTSKPVQMVALTAIRSAPYALDLPGFDTWYEAITTRISYLENAILSFASTVYNFVAAVIATFLAGVTCGQVDALNNAFKKYWTNTILGGACTAISVIGVATPKYALIAGGLAGAGAGGLLVSRLEDLEPHLKFLNKDMNPPEFIKALYEKFRPQLVEAAAERFSAKDSAEAFAKLDKFFDNIEVLFGDVASKFETNNRSRFSSDVSFGDSDDDSTF